VLRAIMDISARAFPFTDRPQRAIGVTSVRTRSEDRSSILSSPLAGLGWKLLIRLRHRLLVMFDCVFTHLFAPGQVVKVRLIYATHLTVCRLSRPWLLPFDCKRT
jgi:hypothetical protein